METKRVTVQGLKAETRYYGENGNGAALTVFTDAGPVEVSTSKKTEEALRACITKLVGQQVDLPAEKTQYGVKVDKDFRFPGDPRGAPGQNPKRDNKGGGNWESPTERAFKEASITAQVAAKIVADVVAQDGQFSEFEARTIVVAKAIRAASRELFADGSYPLPSKPEAPKLAPTASNGQQAPTTISARIEQLVDIGGDTLAVKRAKQLLREKNGSEDLGALDDTAWGAFIRAFAEVEQAGKHA